MDTYTRTSEKASTVFLKAYSTSFSSSSLLFDKTTRRHIGNIYGLVRVADEIVDTYRKKDSLEILNDLEQETYRAIKRGYSSNPIVHSFAYTAKLYNIDKPLIQAFYNSMRADLSVENHSKSSLDDYVYGSAEVIGLMCLKIFCGGDESEYNKLSSGAKALGSVYQKVNFLRDLSNDSNNLGRLYFPELQNGLTDENKNKIVKDIKKELALADKYISRLPASAKKAVTLSRDYYSSLLSKLEKTTIDDIMEKRIRINNLYKIWLFIKVVFK